MKKLSVLAMALGGLLLFGLQDAQAANAALDRLKRDLDRCAVYTRLDQINACIKQAADRAYKGIQDAANAVCGRIPSDAVKRECFARESRNNKPGIDNAIAAARARATAGSPAETARVRKSCDGLREPYRQACIAAVASCGNIRNLQECVNNKLKALTTAPSQAPKPQPAVQPAAPRPTPKPQPAVQPAAPSPAPKPQPAVQPAAPSPAPKPQPAKASPFQSPDPLAARDILDAAFYLGKYPDLRKAFGTDLARATQHWLSFGIKEGRQSSPTFSVQAYLNRYPDLQRAFGPRNYPAAVQHWIGFGRNERRNPRP